MPSFSMECEKKISTEVYEKFTFVFDTFPIAAVLECELGRWFCCHGGLGMSCDVPVNQVICHVTYKYDYCLSRSQSEED